MRTFFSGFILMILFCLSVQAAEPEFPILSGQVVDEAGVLTPQTKVLLTRLLATDKDNQVAVAVLKDLRGKNGREYGIELARRWQLGQKGKDNGVLILISKKDRYAGIEVGYGLESILPDSVSGRILREAVLPPLKKDADYNRAVLNGAAAVMSVLSDGRLKDGEEGDEEDVLATLFALFMLYLFLSGRGPRGGAGMFLRGGRGMSRGFFGGGGNFGGGGAGGRF